MFLKPYKVKSNAPLKGSDSRRMRTRVEEAFPNLTTEQIQQLFPNRSNVSVVKVITHSDLITNIFCVNKLPMFFEYEGSAVLAPSVYALWLVPDLLPYFTTFPAVLPKLSNGADLMLPGVVPVGTGMNIYGRYKKGQLVGINLTSNKSAVGVGVLSHSSDDLYMSGGRGSAVKILHVFGDKLWSHEPTMVQQIPRNETPCPKADEFPPLNGETKKSNKSQEAKPEIIVDSVTLVNVDSSKTELQSDKNELPAMETLNITEETHPTVKQTVEDELSGKISPDLVLKNAFLCALKNHGKTLQLPLLTSNFYRLYVVPEARTQIDLKKTKYKKLSNFLNEMIELGFIVVREETKGVDKITSIDLEHPELVNFITDFKKPTTACNTNSHEQPLFRSELTELYLVTDETAAFFTKMDYKRGEGIPAVKIRKIIREYISKNHLPYASNADPNSFKLDECLAAICECEEASLSKICSVILSKMSHSYQMCSAKNAPANKPLIQMSLATRSGNKKVTLVSNVECYGINVPELIKLCKQGAAASTTIVKLPNQKREQLQIQGNQIRFIYTLLTETYKIPGKCILGLELAKDGKKNKK